jgi:hypothetical protein
VVQISTQYLVPEDLMEGFLVAVAAQTDEPLMFRKGEATLVEGVGEVHQDFMLLVVPQHVEDGAMSLPPVEDGNGDAQEYSDDTDEGLCHDCD